jgi:3-phenylpropionate/trans-cinnamate dioxygenase ferredoxin subunit
MARYRVGRVSDIPAGSRKVVEVDGRSIGVFNIGGEFYAIRNTCPHQGAELCEGHLTSLVTSPKPGEFCYDREGEIIRCPWHFWEFDIKTGHMIVDPSTRVRTYGVSVEKYDVTVEEREVFVEV